MESIHRSPLVDERQQDRAPSDHVGEWSYRVNAGWLVEENIFPYLMVGDCKGSSRTNTPIDGRQAAGRRPAGRLPREAGAPWSDQRAFRYGYGFGVSCAERVPTVEVSKQSSEDDNYARLLN